MDYTRLLLATFYATGLMWLISSAILSVIKSIPIIREHFNMAMAIFAIILILTTYFYKTLNLE